METTIYRRIKFKQALILTVSFWLLIITNRIPAQNYMYIRSGASGTNNGQDWTNAFPDIPENLIRGITYFIADGEYTDYNFDDDASGTDIISLKKATVAEHGTDIGWNTNYGDDRVQFGILSFNTDYFVFDGVENLGFYVVGQYQGSAVSISGSHVTINQVEVDGNYSENESGYHTGGSCTAMNVTGNYVSVSNSYFHDAADDGVSAGACTGFTFINNTIQHLHAKGTDGADGPCYNGHSDGLEIFSIYDAYFSGNLISDIQSTAAVFMGDWSGNNSNLVFENNIFYTPETGFVFYVHYVDNIKFYHNVFWGQRKGGYGGFSLGHEVTNMDMYNNIILSINTNHMDASYDANEHRINFNLIGSDIGQVPLGSDDIVSSNPLFVNVADINSDLSNMNLSPVREDFSLQEGSPAINTGTSGSGQILPSVDIFGTQRDSLPDLGVYEYNVILSQLNRIKEYQTNVVFPNPASDKIYVTTRNFKEIQIISIHGTKVFSSDKTENEITFLPAGIYIIRIIKTNDSTFTTQLIKY